MSKKMFFTVLSFYIFFLFMISSSLAGPSEGVKILGLGDLKASGIGQLFSGSKVQGTFTAMCKGGLKVWDSSISSVSLGSKTTGSPVIFKVTNLLPLAQGLRLTLDSPLLGPTSMLGQFWVNPGQSIFISIPRSDLVSALTFVKGSKVIIVDSHTDSKMLGDKLDLAG